MTAANGYRPRVVVCGTGFGRIHLRAVHGSPDFELIGVLARGSAESRRIAQSYGVPCFTTAEELPEKTDIACVAVPSGTGGGDGAELAQRLLARGIHVLQELPLHPEELAACLRTAQEHGVCFRGNTFHPHLAPVRRFLQGADALGRHGRPLFIDAACGVQVLPSLLDIVARAVGGPRPWRFADPAPIPPELAALAGSPAPYTAIHGVVGGVPLTLRVQNQLCPTDPDNHALLLHRVSVGCEGGVLSLADTHGPVLWNSRLHSDRDATGRLLLDGPGTDHLDVPTTERLDGPGREEAPAGTREPTFREIFDRLWPDAVVHALTELRREIDDPAASAASGQRVLTLTAMWQDLLTRLGPVELIHPPAPRRMALPELLELSAETETPSGKRG